MTGCTSAGPDACHLAVPTSRRAQAWLADPTVAIHAIKRVGYRPGRLIDVKAPTLKEPRPLPCRTWQGTTAKLLSQWSCPSPALRGAPTMSGYGWTTRIGSNGSLGVRLFRLCWRPLPGTGPLIAGDGGWDVDCMVTSPSQANLMAIWQRRRSGSRFHQVGFTA